MAVEYTYAQRIKIEKGFYKGNKGEIIKRFEKDEERTIANATLTVKSTYFTILLDTGDVVDVLSDDIAAIDGDK